MKRFKTYYKGLISVLVLVWMSSSCVNDDSFFPPGEISDDIVSTVNVVTILNDLGSRGVSITLEDQLCFRFAYPLVLGYNTDSSIRIDNYQGVLDVVSSQSTNFNITGAQFPIEIIFKGSDNTTVIKDKGSLLDVLKECQLDTFRDDFDNFFKQCFKLDYPITLLNNTGTEVILENDEAFDRFIKDQGTNYQPDFEFPIHILVGPGFESVEISTYYEFYEIINNCVGCPDIRFDFKLVAGNSYEFTTNFEIRDNYELFFLINDEIITDQVLDGKPFRRQFDLGTYEICIKVKTPDCPEGKKVCKELVVKKDCPDLFFEFMQDPGSLQYNFTADFIGINETTYNWIVDDLVVEENDGGPNGDNIFNFQFTSGVHKVCIKAFTPLCPDGIEFCEEITVCPLLNFTFEKIDQNTFQFLPAVIGVSGGINVDWSVNDILAGNQPSSESIQLDLPIGTNTVCARIETPECPNGVEFCEEILVCPELFIEPPTNVGATYTFTANFIGMQEITYQWTINGVVQESDGGAGGDNELIFQFTADGNYDVCIITEVPGCTTGTEFCINLNIIL